MLRTVTFSDKRVADAVNSKFVAAWTNRGPGFVNTTFWAEQGIAERNYEIYPTKNICTFFLTPDRKVFYYAAGSYAPEVFLKILETASTLRKTLFDDRLAPKENGAALAKQLHEEKAEAYASLQEEAQQGENWRSLVKDIRPGNYRGLRHVHSASCAWSLKEGYDYLAALHREWSTRTSLPAFDDLRYQYLYGNEFTEESETSKHITKPEPTQAKPVAKSLRAIRVPAAASKDVYGTDLPGLRLFGQ